MSDGLLWHRIQFAFTITFHYLFPQLTMGLALLIVVFKVARPAPRRRALQRGRPVLGPDLRPQLRHGRRDRHPDGVPVRDQLGAVLPLLRRGRRPGPGDGGRVRVLPRVDVPGAVPVRREAARPERTPRGGRRPGSWARGSRATSSSSPTPSCSTRSATGWARTGSCTWRASGRTSSTPGRSGSTPTTWRPRSSRPRSSSPPSGPTGR